MKKINLLLGIVGVLLIVSCKPQKNFLYLQDMQEGVGYDFVRHEAVIHCDDKLSITVNCKQPELAIPFNLQNASVKISTGGGVSANTIAESENEVHGYRVDKDGCIEFPVLGKIYLEGRTVSEARDYIKNRIIESKYITDPIVTLEFLNFRYTVIGAAGAGSYSSGGDQITMIEAIARAGDLNGNARADHIAVIREIGNERQIFHCDLRTKDIFDSPCYYLQQNDIIYIEPKSKRTSAADVTWRVISTGMSLLSLACTFMWYYRSVH